MAFPCMGPSHSPIRKLPVNVSHLYAEATGAFDLIFSSASTSSCGRHERKHILSSRTYKDVTSSTIIDPERDTHVE